MPERFGYLKGKIGRLVSTAARTTSCTAFCVADDVMATASHCLFSADSEGRLPALSSFGVELDGNGSAMRTKIAGDDENSAQWNVIAGTTHFPVHSPLHNTRDWALLKLASNICANRVLPVSPIHGERKLLEAVQGKQVFTVGFMRRGTRIDLLYSGACETTEKIDLLKKVWSNIRGQFVDPENIIPHRCGFGPGASGSPVFLNEESGAAVVALNSGTL